MNRNVLRRQALLDDPFDFRLRNRRQGRVVAVHKRKAHVLIADKQRRTRAFRILLNEAEDAVVTALPRHHRLELDAPPFAFILVNFDLPLFAIRLDDFKCQDLLASRQKAKVQRIAHPPPVDRPHPVTRRKFEFLSQ